MTVVRQATIHDLDLIAPLFDGYRQFYGQPSDLERARRFIAERFQHHESVILLALDQHRQAVGFTQLYPLFSSVRAARTYLLNDLFVSPDARRGGVAGALLDAAAAFGRAMGVAGLSLQTAHDNLAAQRLYEAKGWVLDQAFREYSLSL